MKKLKILMAMVLVAAMGLVGCRANPVRNVDKAPVVTSSKTVSLDQVTKAIQRAGTALGWNMKVITPGHIEGTLFIRKHMAKVDVKYSTTSYSITYKDSQNLNYDGSTIHNNYNGWVQNLDRGIKSQLSLI